MEMRLLMVCCVMVLLLAAGCSRPTEDVPAVPTPWPQSVELDGQVWTLLTNTTVLGDANPNSHMLFDAAEYREEGSSQRVLALRKAVDQKRPTNRICWFVEQSLTGSDWVRNGKEIVVFDDGLKYESTYSMGQRHGTQRVWYPSGKLKASAEFKVGKLDGVCEGWYESGAPEYRTVYVQGVQGERLTWDAPSTESLSLSSQPETSTQPTYR